MRKTKLRNNLPLTFSTGWKSYVKPNVPTEPQFLVDEELQ